MRLTLILTSLLTLPNLARSFPTEKKEALERHGLSSHYQHRPQNLGYGHVVGQPGYQNSFHGGYGQGLYHGHPNSGHGQGGHGHHHPYPVYPNSQHQGPLGPGQGGYPQYWNLGWLNPFSHQQNHFQSFFETSGGVMAKPHVNIPLVPQMPSLVKTGSNDTITAENKIDSN